MLRRQQPLSYRPIFPCFIASICRVVEELYTNCGASKCPHPQRAQTYSSYCESGPQLGVIFRCGRVVCKQGIKILPIPIYIFPHFRSRARRASLANTPPLQIIIILHATIERISARTLLYSESKNTKLYIPKSRAINPSRDNKFALFMNTALSRRRSFSACVIFSHSFKRLHAGWTL